jgi:hypothetical protein
MGIFGAAKKVAPIAGAIIGGAFGGPAGASAGASAGKAISKIGNKPPVTSFPISVPTANSLDMARGQDRSRMKRSYNYPSD